MIDVRPFDSLGQFANDWLTARYHFSFADYHHDARMGCGALRVWNDDAIQPGCGFSPHSHRDMEIITYVRQGAITHHDSLGNVGVTAAGQVQIMSAGTGITHAEYNRGSDLVRLFQIWIHPRQRGLPPRWETNPFPRQHGSLQLLASGMADDIGVPVINQDARVWAATLDAGTSVTQRLAGGGEAYLVPARGCLLVDGVAVKERDGVRLHGQSVTTILAVEESEFVLVDLGSLISS